MLRKLYLLFILTGFVLHAQNQRVSLNGTITYHSKAQKDIHIFNINAHNGTISDLKGHFSIMVKENDTLLISGIQFYSIGLPITKDIVQKGYIVIDLMQRVNTLQEVQVYAHKLDGFLLVDSEKEQPANFPEKEALTIPQVDIPSKSVAKKLDPEYLPDPTDPAPEGGGDLIGLVNLVTGNALQKIGKNHPRGQKITPAEKVAALSDMYRFFGETFFTEQLKIPAKEIDVFLAYADRDDRASTFYRQKKFLQLTDLLYRSSLTFGKD